VLAHETVVERACYIRDSCPCVVEGVNRVTSASACGSLQDPSSSTTPSTTTRFNKAHLAAALHDPGYATVRPATAHIEEAEEEAEEGQVWWSERGVPLRALAETVRALRDAGWPPVLVFMYDEVSPAPVTQGQAWVRCTRDERVEGL
jgi:hypothetical protein